VTGLLFGLALFFSPIVAAIPPEAYGPALIHRWARQGRPLSLVGALCLTRCCSMCSTANNHSFTAPNPHSTHTASELGGEATTRTRIARAASYSHGIICQLLPAGNLHPVPRPYRFIPSVSV